VEVQQGSEPPRVFVFQRWVRANTSETAAVK
jgi:hypothetical protein